MLHGMADSKTKAKNFEKHFLKSAFFFQINALKAWDFIFANIFQKIASIAHEMQHCLNTKLRIKPLDANLQPTYCATSARNTHNFVYQQKT